MIIVASSTVPAVVIALRAGAGGELAPGARRDLAALAAWAGVFAGKVTGPVRFRWRARISGTGCRAALPPEAARIGRNAPDTPLFGRIRGGSPVAVDSGRKRASSGDSGAGNRACRHDMIGFSS
jgi:hypothetical protein